MRVSLEWLNDYVDIRDIPAVQLASRLTMAGIAVEAIEEDGDDTILELELTPNRGDCNGMINVAREVAALLDRKLTLPVPVPREQGVGRAEDMVGVQILDPDLCLRYVARVVTDIKIEPSPEWMQTRLTRAGVRAINNIVDITNYVMLEFNQPLHAFDYGKVANHQIVVRRARAGETLYTLDEQERKLSPDMLVIADPRKAVALAGVMGGLNSEISLTTRTVLLESASFHPTNTRRTAVKLGLRTDAAARFEKGANPEATLPAINRAAQLIEELGAGRVVPGVVDVYPQPMAERVITLRPERVNKLLGSRITARDMVDYLRRLGFSVEPEGKEYRVTVPPHRPDVEMEADLVEEIARMYGYDRIPSTLPVSEVSVTGFQEHSFARKVTDILSRSMFQVVSYSFISPRSMQMLNLPEDSPLQQTVNIANPLSEEQSVMRTTLLPGLLEIGVRNLARQNDDLAIYEVGNVFFPEAQGLPRQEMMAGGFCTGRTTGSWSGGQREMDFYFLKGIVDNLLETLDIQGYQWLPCSDNPTYHPQRTARVVKDGLTLALAGELHPLVLEAWGIKKRGVAFEAWLERLEGAVSKVKRVRPIPRFPAIFRDLAVVVEEKVTAEDMEKIVRAAGGELLQQVTIFDVYRSPQLGEGKKSIALNLKFQTADRTLRDEEVGELTQRILGELKARVGATLR